MKTHFTGKMTAIICALCLALGVAGVVLFAGGVASAADEDDGILIDVDLEEIATPLPADVTDNRSTVPWCVDDIECGECQIWDGVPYVNVQLFCSALGLDVTGSGTEEDYRVTGSDIELEAAGGDLYFSCNGRYFYVPEGVRFESGYALLPVDKLAECFGVSAYLNRSAWRVMIAGEPFAPESGDTYYAETDVYWLSRVIYAEVGDQSLPGQMAVGNVILNRVADEGYADNVYDVIFEKNQFDVVINGMIYMEPSQSAEIAAKLALEGYNVVSDAMYFSTSDPGDGYCIIAWIGDHCFMAEA